jgi:hypothetical protein
MTPDPFDIIGKCNPQWSRHAAYSTSLLCTAEDPTMIDLSVVAMSIGYSHSSGMKGREAMCKAAIQDVAGRVSGSLTW